jgi:hypothetical protein
MNGSILTNVAVSILEILGIENPDLEDIKRFIEITRLDKLPDIALWIISTGLPFAKWAIRRFLLNSDEEITAFMREHKEVNDG